MPNPLFWLPFPVDRWLGELAGALRPEQKGALMDLLATAWTQQPPCTLPSDDVYLASRSGLGPSWKRLAPSVLAHFQPTADNRLVCPWLLEIYESQLTRYRNKKERNDRFRRARETSSETSPESSPESSHKASQNGRRRADETSPESSSETSSPLARRTRTRTRRSIESSNELSNAPAPEARASAGEARAAPGAGLGEGPDAPDTPSENPGSDRRRNGQESGPETVADALQKLRPPGAVLRPSVAKERELAVAWAHEHPDDATRIELALHDDVLWEKARPKQRESMLVSAFVKAMKSTANPDVPPAHAEVFP